jgi:hypothetical protein
MNLLFREVFAAAFIATRLVMLISVWSGDL